MKTIVLELFNEVDDDDKVVDPETVEWWKNNAFIAEMDKGYDAWETGKEKAFTLEETDAAIAALRKKRSSK